MTKECPICDSKEVTVEDTLDTFHYGNKKFGDEAELTTIVPIHICHKCNFKWTDYKAGKIYDKTVRRYRKTGKTYYKPIKWLHLIGVIISTSIFLLLSIWILFSLFC